MPDKTLLTYADVVARVENAAAGRLDYVNAVRVTAEHPEWDPDLYTEGDLLTCTYLTPDGQPSCIVGQAFYFDLLEEGLTPYSPFNSQSIGVIIKDVLSPCFDITQKALSFLEVVQSFQDQGETWGAAISAAKLAADADTAPGGYDDFSPYDFTGRVYV